MKKSKKLLSLLLALTMIMSMLSVSAFAAVTNPFTDVSSDDWYYDEIQYVYENDLMLGTSTTAFSPDLTVNRAMMVTILYRLEGEPAVSTSGTFTDVPAGQYYSDAVAWAVENKITKGCGGGLFGPNDQLTREQMATFYYRYAEHKGYDMSVGENTNILSYTDFGDISEYAISTMQWACGEGLIKGTSDTTLSPQGAATRAQLAVILYRFCEKVAAEFHTVAFDYNYDNKGIYKTATIEDGKTVSKPDNPNRSNYSFNGWYTKPSGGEKFDFDTAISADLTLYARWIYNGGGGGGYTPPVHEHTYDSAWSYDSEKHWHAASCGHEVKKDEEVHIFENGVCICGLHENDMLGAFGLIHVEMQEGIAYVDASKSYIEVSDADQLQYVMSNYGTLLTTVKDKFNVASESTVYLWGWTIKLGGNIDFDGKTIAPMAFPYGLLDGQGNTIKNVKVVGLGNKDKETVGLFKTIGKVSDLNVSNIDVSTTSTNAKVGTVAGYTASDWNDVSVDNFSVSVSAKSGSYAGGLLGTSYGDKTSCSVSNGTITNGKNVGGFAGYVCVEKGTTTLSDCSVTNVAISGTTERPTTVGSFVGRLNEVSGSLTLTDCTVTNVTGENVSTDSIYGDIPNNPVVIDGVLHFDFGIVCYKCLNAGQIDAANSYIEVRNADELLYVANNYSTIENKIKAESGASLPYLWAWTIKLGGNIDFVDATIAPMTWSYGSLEGQNYTISNVKVESSTEGAYVGLFETIGSVKNLSLEKIQVTASGKNAKVGILAGYSNGATANVSVNHFSVIATGEGSYAAGMFGSAYGDKTNCSVSDGTINAGSDSVKVKNVGGFAGYICVENEANDTKLNKCSVSKVVINAYNDSSRNTIGSFVGRLNEVSGNLTLTDCTVTEVTGENVPTDRIYGDIPNNSVMINGVETSH